MGPIAWSRPDLDLDTLTTDSRRRADRARPPRGGHPRRGLDGRRRLRPRPRARACAATARRPASLAEACAGRGVDLAVVSTNEVFDGKRTDGRGYAPGRRANADQRRTARASSSGELLAEAAIGARPAARLGDRPDRVAVRPAGQRLPGEDRRPRRSGRRGAGEPLKAVDDEIGTPTYTPDLADAIVELIWEDALFAGPGRRAIHHLVNGGRASRADWAREVLRATGIDVRDRGRPGVAPGSGRARRRRGPSSSRRRCRPASRCATGGSRSPTRRPALPTGTCASRG